MGTGAGPDLAAAVSNAGGFGVIGASAFLPDAIPGLIAQVRDRTARPFGVNFIIDERDSSDEDKAITRQQVNAAITERVAAVILFWGDPAPYVEEAHRYGVRIIIQVGSLDEAKAAAAAGVDAVIAQGVEAGGHVEGTTSIWTLLPAVVEAITPRPVLASGGIGDGAGVARAIGLGAQGVSLGTRFVASDEFSAHPAYKPGNRPGEGTSIGRRRIGSGDIVDWPRYAIGVAPPDFDGDIEYAPLWAGESCSVVNDIKPAGDIVRDLARDADAILAAAAGMPETESRPS
ncbi:MAG: hypothetical protein AUG96_00190 [Chloroflexi bacterium 13_1_20CM_4_66_15]|nr:MAG: hypothetical protein AUG96_00190 [Chloroflexi bacterium 13_1_20CM_4_66_15]